MQLDPSESINNMGTLRIDVLDGKDMPSADRNGYSDPFCRFVLNEKEVFKTQVQKKTLQPAWNEFFEVEIPSRTAADFQCKVYDWDFASDPDFLGATAINLDLLEPFKPQEMVLALDGKSGSVRLRALFRPAYVQRSRQGSSTFSGTFAVPGKIVTGVAGVPIKGVGMAAHGVGKGASFIRRGFRTTSKEGTSIVAEESASPTPLGDPFSSPHRTTISTEDRDVSDIQQTPPSAGLPSPHNRSQSIAGSVMTTNGSSAPSGLANFIILAANGFPAKESIFVVVKRLPDKKTIHKTKHLKSSNSQIQYEKESFSFKCTADTQFQIQVRSHSTFGSGEELGETIYFVDESGSGADKSIACGSGTVVLRSSFIVNEDSEAGSGGLKVPSGGLRKSLMGKRDGRQSRDGGSSPSS